ncbi:MAG: hypothetical protein WBG90_14255 [Saonia sp.]
MIKKNRGTGFVALIFIGILLLCTYYTYNVFFSDTRIMDMAEERTDIAISSDSLISSFIVDENLANSRYVEKTIEVEGVIREVNFLNNRYTVFLQGENQMACLMCDMQTDQTGRIKKLKLGQTVRLKGICKGFLMDAILLNCVIINKKTNE